ncbi:MAG: hypothetical protein LC632_01005 [Xanthomonadaceae bacterium]|nr:hypothetical protein [Xanthomonadaceae bacterium]
MVARRSTQVLDAIMKALLVSAILPAFLAIASCVSTPTAVEQVSEWIELQYWLDSDCRFVAAPTDGNDASVIDLGHAGAAFLRAALVQELHEIDWSQIESTRGLAYRGAPHAQADHIEDEIARKGPWPLTARGLLDPTRPTAPTYGARAICGFDENGEIDMVMLYSSEYEGGRRIIPRAELEPGRNIVDPVHVRIELRLLFNGI